MVCDKRCLWIPAILKATQVQCQPLEDGRGKKNGRGKKIQIFFDTEVYVFLRIIYKEKFFQQAFTLCITEIDVHMSTYDNFSINKTRNNKNNSNALNVHLYTIHMYVTRIFEQ